MHFNLVFRYKVSNFSFDLLMKIANDPLFNIEDINPSLYKKAKHLATVRVSQFAVMPNFSFQLFKSYPTDQIEQFHSILDQII